MKIRVECYAGYRGEETPRAFWLGDNRLEVKEVLDRWLAPEQRGIHLSRDALQADCRGVSLGAPASCRLLTGVDALKPARTPALPGSDCPALSW